MPDTSAKTVSALKKTISTQNDKIVSLVMSVSDLKDDVARLKHELASLRSTTSEDLKVLYDRTA
tara:strand:- start:148 stop:339 length:192 start_codon:yes stop_codon:yes gene_type:complete